MKQSKHINQKKPGRSRKKKKSRINKYIILSAGSLLLIMLVAMVCILYFERDSHIREEIELDRRRIVQNETVDDIAEHETTVRNENTEHTEVIGTDISSDGVLPEIQNVINSYNHLGLVDVSGYLNVRAEPDINGEIIGRLSQHGACEILDTEGEWSQIRSGEVEGYINNQYILTGEDAETAAISQVKPMAVVTADSLNIRSTPSQNPENVVGAAVSGERYEIISRENGWVQIDEGYISEEYVEIRYALEEATKLDLREMAINQYENLVISKVNNYLNVRSSPENQGDNNIIGKLPGRAAGEILEKEDGWYHIQSGSINGYISSDPQYTAIGPEAVELAMQSAELMVIVNTERLNVRTEASIDSSIWTQISEEERYPVVQQLDGWVQIELDSSGEGDEIDTAYISTRDNNVEVRYALAEAIKFSPLEEREGQESSLRARIVNYALQFVGNPYVWGGTSLTNGADCSGFVLSVMRQFGISLPRTSSAQSQTGTTISSSNIQPGDLVFYANGSGTVNHVAMYIGNGQVVHASSRRTGIRISTWNYRTPKVIKRVL